MNELLAKYKGVAPWIGMVGVLVLNIVALSYWTGTLSQRIEDHNRRLIAVEQSDKEQSAWLVRIGSMETKLTYIYDEFKAFKVSQDAKR